MNVIGQLSILDISQEYNLGYIYSQNIMNRLEDIGYIKKKEDYIYEIIQTEFEIDNYIKLHMEELRPKIYSDVGLKDNGKIRLKDKAKHKLWHFKSVAPIFARRMLFSIPQAFILIIVMLFLSTVTIDNRSIHPSEYLILLIVCGIFIVIPSNVLIRIIQAKIYKINFKNFMLLPKNWFFKRCKDTIDMHIVLKQNGEKFKIGNYESIKHQLLNILNKKRMLYVHYMKIASNAESEDELWKSINSIISTLKYMEQYEKFNIFSDRKPSEDLKLMDDITQILIDRFNNRIEQRRTHADYDKMDGHEFEYFCADLLRKNGFDNVEVTQGSGDHGIDILAEKDGISYAIQCKCYSSNIGNAAVQQAHTGKSLYQRDIAVVLTNRYFTPQAVEEASYLGVKLWGRDKLNELCETESVKDISKSELKKLKHTKLYRKVGIFSIQNNTYDAKNIAAALKEDVRKVNDCIGEMIENGIISTENYEKTGKFSITMTEKEFVQSLIK